MSETDQFLKCQVWACGHTRNYHTANGCTAKGCRCTGFKYKFNKVIQKA